MKMLEEEEKVTCKRGQTVGVSSVLLLLCPVVVCRHAPRTQCSLYITGCSSARQAGAAGTAKSAPLPLARCPTYTRHSAAGGWHDRPCAIAVGLQPHRNSGTCPVVTVRAPKLALWACLWSPLTAPAAAAGARGGARGVAYADLAVMAATSAARSLTFFSMPSPSWKRTKRRIEIFSPIAAIASFTACSTVLELSIR